MSEATPPSDSLTRYIGGRKYSLCVLVASYLFISRTIGDITGDQLLTGLLATVGANSGGNLLQEWWTRVRGSGS